VSLHVVKVKVNTLVISDLRAEVMFEVRWDGFQLMF